ncbi:MaoC family dehydratase [Pseudomaricurvus alkylphenolicus]|jgi:hypothetical protein|uniref:MaoC family dehydratase N-terminal domain-containing protein n=1 Tax=Pseudomaricurvus alkylphenolicus TaxID=1306991 RepID=UPI00141F6DD0|nr:MaoC family dehydratase N-terminal domain-containing protein [Pseudomaricurvus alkylphenolicus]NIB40082.1 MaoC family dehydratase [Pseudomaricurvus alkylphenolicus]
MLDRSFIGHTFEPHTVEVEKGKLRFFAKAIGETDPIYFEESAARDAGYRNIPAPPSYPFSIDLEAPEFLPFLQLLDMDIGRILHGDQTFEYFGQICAGDTITCQASIKDMFDKKGGALEFVVMEVTFTNQDGELVVRSTQSIVYRN